MKKGFFSEGFTLLELLIVVGILALLLGVIGACFTGGLRVWEAARSFGNRESEVLTGCEILEKDLANSFPFRAIPFQGRIDMISFATPVVGRQESEGDDGFRIGTVKYVFDKAAGALTRIETSYSISGKPATERVETVMREVSGFALSYWGAPSGAAGLDLRWQDSWEGATNLPAAVRIRIAFSGESETEVLQLERTVLLPVAMGLQTMVQR
ncbi:MAG: prepilin-type N-terminal cleavage/methylation domain-containing protein [Kiritimatiellia bacterium]